MGPIAPFRLSKFVLMAYSFRVDIGLCDTLLRVYSAGKVSLSSCSSTRFVNEHVDLLVLSRSTSTTIFVNFTLWTSVGCYAGWLLQPAVDGSRFVSTWQLTCIDFFFLLNGGREQLRLFLVGVIAFL